MVSYLVHRLAGTLPVLLLISFLVFSLIHAAPGDPTLLLLGEETNACMVYTQSDEITLAWYSTDPKSQIWFAGRYNKKIGRAHV